MGAGGSQVMWPVGDVQHVVTSVRESRRGERECGEQRPQMTGLAVGTRHVVGMMWMFLAAQQSMPIPRRLHCVALMSLNNRYYLNGVDAYRLKLRISSLAAEASMAVVQQELSELQLDAADADAAAATA